MKDYKKDKIISKGQKRDKKLTKIGSKFTKKMFRLILVVLILLFLANIFIYNSEGVIMTEYGQISAQYQGTALFVRDEEVKLAPSSGRVSLEIEEGARVQPGRLVAQVRTPSQDYKLYNYQGGLISYYIDGLETTLTPDSLDSLSYEKFQSLAYKINQIQDGERVNSGQPIFKVVDNFNLYLVLSVPEAGLELFNLGARVQGELVEFEEVNFSAAVQNIINSETGDLVVLKVREYLPIFTKLRESEVNLISSSYNGIVVPLRALVEKDGRIGVVVLESNVPQFNEVRVLKRGENKAVVQGIEFGIKISTNAKERLE